MNCKFCNAELQEETVVCPVCGKNLTEEETVEAVETVETVEAIEAVETVEAAEAAEEVISEEIAAEETPKKKKVWPLVLAIVGAVVALGVLAVVLLTCLGVQVLPKANDINKKDSYTVTDEKAIEKADTVVATIGDKQLTNSQLQIFYYTQIAEFLSYYGDYASQIGLDYTQPLSEQPCYFDEELSWEQYFLDIALETWQRYQVLGITAEQANHQLTAEYQEALDAMPADLEEQAKTSELESAEALVQSVIGANCTVEEYIEHVRLNFLANDYYGTQYEKLAPTDEEAEAYFNEQTESFAENGITKDSGLISSVRHILVFPEGGTTDETTGATTYSEKEWEACLKKAEEILAHWEEHGKTEEGFIELVGEYSEDGGSNTNGGLYEGIYKGSGMVEPFESWSIDASRKSGDVGIVKADFDHYKGYHIIYFVSGEPHWLYSAREMLLTERTDKILEDGKEEWPMKVKYSKIALAELKFA